MTVSPARTTPLSLNMLMIPSSWGSSSRETSQVTVPCYLRGERTHSQPSQDQKIILEFRKNRPPLQPLIKWSEVERADSHGFLGLQDTSDLSWLHFIRLLRNAGRHPVTQAYRGLIESILTVGITICLVWEQHTGSREEGSAKSHKEYMDTMCVQRCRKRLTLSSSLSAQTQTLHVQPETLQSRQHHHT
ncbi:hypothetical protein AMECASPLE_023684 [Ameca splendens]|uniref:Uncharacterized protein n=1 Tax=Ameca splendens TaxID=208324 RepID=A0ABV0YF88_9TELE